MDKFINYITRVCKFSWNVFAGILGVLFIIIMVISWLGFFGFIEPKPVDPEYPCIPNYMGGCDFF